MQMKSIIIILVFTVVTSIFAKDTGFDMGKLRDETSQKSLVGTTSSSSVASSDSNSTENSMYVLLFRVVGSLVFLGFAVFAVVWGIKKSGIINGGAPLSKSSFELMQSFSTTPGTAIVMVRFEDSVLLLGQTSASVNLLKTIEGEEANKLITNHHGNETVSSFQKNLNSFVSKLNKSGEEIEESA